MVRHLGWSAPLPKTADPELDTDSVFATDVLKRKGTADDILSQVKMLSDHIGPMV